MYLDISGVSQNTSILAPQIDMPAGTYDRIQIVELTGFAADSLVYYSLDGETWVRYWGPVAIRKSCMAEFVAVRGNERSMIISAKYEIIKPYESKRGSVVVIGGAEHCRELHNRIVELAGGTEKIRVAFIPTSSADPYSSGMDRVARFRDLCGVEINENEVPLTGGKKDFSHMENNSRFWILPVAVKDDVNTCANPERDYDTPLADESTFPDIHESTWINNGFKKDVAEKLRDGNYNTVFLTGGNQSRYLKCFMYPDWSDGPVLSVIRDILEEKGGVVAGTSAGAAVISNIMIQGGGSYGSMLEGVVYEDVNLVDYDDEYTPFANATDGRVWLGRGFGFLSKNFITGTHFISRGRTGRLVTAALYLKKIHNMPILGFGVGEDTAVIISQNNKVEVVGALGALVIDTSKSQIVFGDVEKGRFCVKDLKLHYLESGDSFAVDPDTGETSVASINPTKQEIHLIEDGEFSYSFEADIFGRATLKKFLFNNLINNDSSDCVGLELVDNLYDSYDSILYHDLIKDGTMLLRFTKNERTKGYKGTIGYHWYGYHDSSYPRLLHDVENDRFSFKNVITDIFPLKVFNFPDLSDGEDMPLKQHYMEDGYTEAEWNELFSKRKRFRFGFMLIPFTDTQVEVRTFFFDYAYFDKSRTGTYTPPRLQPIGENWGYKDYDIVEIDKADGSQVFINGILRGTTDKFGKLIIDQTVEIPEIKVFFQGKTNSYSVEHHNVSLPLTIAVIKFTPESYK